MATINSIFRFRNGEYLQGWVLTPDSTYPTYLDGRWYIKNPTKYLMPGSKAENPEIYNFFGTMALTQREGAAAATNSYWEQTCTWEDLGVPVGATVTAAKVTYAYRWQAPYKYIDTGQVDDEGNPIFKYQARSSLITFFVGDAQTGPVTIRKSDGTLIGTTSAAVNCIGRNPTDYWQAYPGPALASGADVQSQWNQAYAVVNGSNVTITGSEQASNATMKFRIGVKMPRTNDHFWWLRNKLKDVIVTVTYTLSSGRRRTSTIVI